MNIQLIAALITLMITLICAAWDMWAGRIPNVLTFPAMLVGMGLGFLRGGLAGLKDSCLGLLVGAAMLFIPFALGGIGPGDVKLLAAVGALNGYAFAFRAFIFAAMAGGAIAAGMLAQNLAVFQGCIELARKKSFPYGLAIMVGVSAAYLLG